MSLPGHVTIFKFGDINQESRYHEPCMKGQNGPVTHGDILSFFRGMVSPNWPSSGFYGGHMHNVVKKCFHDRGEESRIHLHGHRSLPEAFGGVLFAHGTRFA